MLASVRWLNRYLDPAGIAPSEVEHVLTHVGFPIESREDLPGGGGDARLDVELTSNRGDCLCHVGLAREVAAATGRRLVTPKVGLPATKAGAPSAAKLTSVENRLVGGGCPRFTARVIRGVKVGPSPKWLVEALESIGHRSINNVVDVSNFVLFELGHPSHTFDMKKLAGERIVVRYANEGEAFTALDGRKHALGPADMVVADAERAQGLAGVIGGLDSSVTAATTDVLIEVATWDPVRVRRAARRLEIRTDASHRYERYVDARDLEMASRRVAQLILETAGGELAEGMVDASAALPARTAVSMRAARCTALLGIEVPTPKMVALLTALGIEVHVERHTGNGRGEELRCLIPHHRPDLTREVDLIEEVARLNGLESIRIAPAMEVPLNLGHPAAWGLRERAADEMGRVLTGQGFFETVTFSFISKDRATLFLPPGMRALQVDEARRTGEPFLRPSVIPSLLTCRRANQDAKVRAPGGVRLYETASVFCEVDDGKAFKRQTVERRVLALLADAPPAPGGSRAESLQAGVRLVRGALEAVALALGGPGAAIGVTPLNDSALAYKGESVATALLGGKAIGQIATVSGATLAAWELEEPVVAAEVDLDALIALYPPRARAQALARFPSIERDLSVVVDETVSWERFERVIAAAKMERHEAHEFVGVFRGKQLGAGKKSVTFRLTFRDPDRTLRHEEVDAPVARLVEQIGKELGGVLRQ